MVKNLPAMQETRFDPWVRKIPCRREWLLTLVFLPGEFHGQRSLVGNSPWGHKESDMTEQLSPSREKEYSGNCYKANLTGTKKVGCVPLMDDLKC